MAHKKFYKTVLLPIQVSEGEYCWGYGKICNHFDNEGGHPTCKLGFDVDIDKDGHVKKPKECSELKEKMKG
jgi:hypothetical protein